MDLTKIHTPRRRKEGGESQATNKAGPTRMRTPSYRDLI